MKGGDAMNFTGGRLLEFERMMKENPGFKHEPIEAMEDQGYTNGLYSGRYDKNRTEDTDKSGGHTYGRFFNAQNGEVK